MQASTRRNVHSCKQGGEKFFVEPLAEQFLKLLPWPPHPIVPVERVSVLVHRLASWRRRKSGERVAAVLGYRERAGLQVRELFEVRAHHNFAETLRPRRKPRSWSQASLAAEPSTTAAEWELALSSLCRRESVQVSELTVAVQDSMVEHLGGGQHGARRHAAQEVGQLP